MCSKTHLKVRLRGANHRVADRVNSVAGQIGC